jgi:hypothetical protein
MPPGRRSRAPSSAPGPRSAGRRSWRAGPGRLEQIADHDDVGESAMGASGSRFTATIDSAVCIPTLCWMAPLIPSARYSCGLTILPVWPICCAYGIQPESTAARLAPTAPPAPRLRTTPKPSAPPTPRPPATMILASSMGGGCGFAGSTTRTAGDLAGGVRGSFCGLAAGRRSPRWADRHDAPALVKPDVVRSLPPRRHLDRGTQSEGRQVAFTERPAGQSGTAPAGSAVRPAPVKTRVGKEGAARFAATAPGVSRRPSVTRPAEARRRRHGRRGSGDDEPTTSPPPLARTTSRPPRYRQGAVGSGLGTQARHQIRPRRGSTIETPSWASADDRGAPQAGGNRLSSTAVVAGAPTRPIEAEVAGRAAISCRGPPDHMSSDIAARRGLGAADETGMAPRGRSRSADASDRPPVDCRVHSRREYGGPGARPSGGTTPPTRRTSRCNDTSRLELAQRAAGPGGRRAHEPASRVGRERRVAPRKRAHRRAPAGPSEGSPRAPR